jgi:hypothetical protein
VSDQTPVTPVTPENPVWVTKYALSGGIHRCDSGMLFENARGVHYITYSSGAPITIGEGAFLSEAEARADVVRQAEAEIKSIEKQVRKLSALIASNGGKVTP